MTPRTEAKRSVSTGDRRHRVLLLGASPNTGNLGVSALAVAAAQLVLDRWSDAEIEILGNTRRPITVSLVGPNRAVAGEQRMWPLRFCLNPFVAHHVIWITLGLCVVRCFPPLRRRWGRRSSTLGALCRAEVCLDITGGDSFSDIYGARRFLLGGLTKVVCRLTGRPLILLPQTYGPFRSRWARWWGAFLLRLAASVYCRDARSLRVAQSLLSRGRSDVARRCPDVAFGLPANEDDSIHVSALRALRARGQILIGVNVSGLLCHGGYSGANEFGLQADYTDLMVSLCEVILEWDDTHLVLVPHVLAADAREDDMAACRRLQAQLARGRHGRVTLIDEPASRRGDPRPVKAVIGSCDFFVGSRMHATIAALSQCVPTVGLAYSDKFQGVYESIQVGDCVIDLRRCKTDAVCQRVRRLYETRGTLRRRLQESVPETHADLRDAFSVPLPFLP